MKQEKIPYFEGIFDSKDYDPNDYVTEKETMPKRAIPQPPLARVIRQGVGHYCPNCQSTMSRKWFLGLFGKRSCDNNKCFNTYDKVKGVTSS